MKYRILLLQVHSILITNVSVPSISRHYTIVDKIMQQKPLHLIRPNTDPSQPADKIQTTVNNKHIQLADSSCRTHKFARCYSCTRVGNRSSEPSSVSTNDFQ